MEKDPDIGIVTGLSFIGHIGNNDMERTGRVLQEKMNPNSITLISSANILKAFSPPESVIQKVSDGIDKIGSDELILIGHSYGALIALVVACRRKLKGISKLFLIDGPLRSDIDVNPSKMAHYLFYRHYINRVILARECEEILPELDTSKIVTIGSNTDRIVPGEAKLLNGNFSTVLMSRNEDITPNSFKRPRGYNIVLPSNHKGHKTTDKRIPIVTDIILCSVQATREKAAQTFSDVRKTL